MSITWSAGVADPNVRAQILGTRTPTLFGAGTIIYYDDRSSSSADDRYAAVMGNGAGALNWSFVGADDTAPQKFWNTTEVTFDDDGGAGVDARHYVNGSQIGTSTRANAFGVGDAQLPLTVCSSGVTTPDVFSVLVYESALSTTQIEINLSITEWALNGTLPIVAAGPSDDVWLFVGDSITSGCCGVTSWATKLEASKPPATILLNKGASGAPTSNILAQWNANKALVPDKVFVLGGINDIANDGTAAAAYANLSTIYSEAAALGTQVIAMPTLPFGTATSWTAPRQAELESLEASIIADLDVDILVNWYALMGEPGTPEDLATIYNQDNIHPNEVGTTFMADTMATALGL
jgi:lysophospholipase L1-like esterase